MLSNLQRQLTHLDLVEEILPNGMAILSTPLGQDGFFISKETSMVKLCECGCGLPAPIATQNSKLNGYIKGVPMRFIYGHWPRGKNSKSWKGGKSKSSDGQYDLTYFPNHPRARVGRKRYVMNHVLTAEKALGRLIPPSIPIHHHNETQLVICQNHAYHKLLHMRTRAFNACGHANWLKCQICKKYDSPENMYLYSGKMCGFHRKCNRIKSTIWRNRVARTVSEPLSVASQQGS